MPADRDASPAPAIPDDVMAWMVPPARGDGTTMTELLAGLGDPASGPERDDGLLERLLEDR